MCGLFCWTGNKMWILLFDTGRNEQLVTLHHIFQLAQVAHIVDLPAKLKTTGRERSNMLSTCRF